LGPSPPRHTPVTSQVLAAMDNLSMAMAIDYEAISHTGSQAARPNL
jgi:hypothetical protein